MLLMFFYFMRKMLKIVKHVHEIIFRKLHARSKCNNPILNAWT